MRKIKKSAQFLSMRVHFETLGCKMNFADSEFAQHELQKMGFAISDENPDFIVINTCTVTDTADKKSRAKTNFFTRTGAQIVVTGCSTKISPDRWKTAFPGCAVCPTPADVVTFFSELSKPEPETGFRIEPERTRKNIPIQTGCDTYCAYCIIPFARGAAHSFSAKKIIDEILEFEKTGGREIILTGINLAAWGCSHTRKPEESKFSELLAEILEKTSIPRIRISSIGPEYIDDKFFEIFQNPRICDHLHVSVQSGSDTILKKMNRGHGTSEISKLLKSARAVRPNAGFSCDVIVGFPGETDELFRETVRQIRAWNFSKLHVFPFSARAGTVAAKMPNQISIEIKKQRSAELRKMGTEFRKKFIAAQIGKKQKVLWEKNGSGWTTNFLRVKNISNVPENTISELEISPEILVE